jgi:nitrogen regulatory protein P-II 2
MRDQPRISRACIARSSGLQKSDFAQSAPNKRGRGGRHSAGSTMKLVIAIIKPFKLDDVRDAVAGLGIAGLTVTEVKGYGRQRGHTEIYRGAEYAVNFLPKMKIEVAVPADRAEKVVAAIGSAAKTGQIGDGKIFVVDLDHAMRIRTGETDEDAL